MAKENKSPAEELVSCEICLKEVPAGEACNPETEDYVAHFCGLDCYEQWKNQDEKSAPQGKKSGA